MARARLAPGVETARLYVKLPATLLQAARDAAQARGESLSDMVRRLLEREVRRRR